MFGSHSTCQICGSSFKSDSKDSFTDKIIYWLDNNPEFTLQYFHNKIYSLNSDDLSNSGPPTSPSLRMRKISSQDFDSNLCNRIISSNPDGRPTFIGEQFIGIESGPAPLPDSKRQKSINEKRTSLVDRYRKDIHSSTTLNERDLIDDLILDIFHELDLTSLCFKIIQNVCILLRADRGSLFLIDYDRTTRSPILVGKLFDVTPEAKLTDILESSEARKIILPLGVGLCGHVAKTGILTNVENAYEDPRFSDEIDKRTGYKTKCVLCMPIKDIDGSVLAVAQIINKRESIRPTSDDDNKTCSKIADSKDISRFSEEDLQIFKFYVAFCGIGLKNAQLYRESRQETHRNQVLLELARIIFTEQLNISRLVFAILSHTITLLQCQRCQLLLLPAPDKSVVMGSSNGGSEVRDDLEVESDLPVEWRIHALLGVPVKNSNGCVIGVCFIVNKSTRDLRQLLADGGRSIDKKQHSCLDTPTSSSVRDDKLEETDGSSWHGRFSPSDECLIDAFLLFAGLGIDSQQRCDRLKRSSAQQRVLLDMLAYHGSAPEGEVRQLQTALIPTQQYYQLDRFNFVDWRLSDQSTLKACLRMFMQMRCMTSLRLDYQALCRWLLTVKKNYRDVTYHNWRHAFNVTQTMFALISRGQLKDVLSDLECLALLVACLSHDLDHRGTNNQYQVEAMSPLAQLYSTSVLEHHHYNMCMILLQREGNSFMSNLSSTDYASVQRLIRHAILATDLSRHFVDLPKFLQLFQSSKPSSSSTTPTDWNCFVWLNDSGSRSLLRSTLMTACDLSASTKPWPVHLVTSELVVSEFFQQGDLEKERLNTQPKPMMDRDNVPEVPKIQIDFIDNLCLPVYEAITKFCAEFRPLWYGCQRNRKCWLLLSQNKQVPSSLYGLEEEEEEEEKIFDQNSETIAITDVVECQTKLQSSTTGNDRPSSSPEHQRNQGVATLRSDSAERILRLHSNFQFRLRRRSVSDSSDRSTDAVVGGSRSEAGGQFKDAS